jgi:hypothetical protein
LGSGIDRSPTQRRGSADTEVGRASAALPVERPIRPLAPFLVAITTVLLIVAFVPETVLLVPRLLGFVK